MRRLGRMARMGAGVAILGAIVACAGPRTAPVEVASSELAAEASRQRQVALQKWKQDRDRLREVGWRILGGSTDLCTNGLRWEYGFTLWNAQSATDEFDRQAWAGAATNTFQLTDRIRIAYVHSGFPAARAGLWAGDELELIEGHRVGSGSGAVEDASARLYALAGQTGGGPIDIRVRRGGAPVGFAVQPVAICDYDLVVEPTDELNAYADGRRIFITQRMLEFARADDELAVVVGHEFAHNAMEHNRSQRENETVGEVAGTILDLAIAATVGLGTGGIFSKKGRQMGAEAYSKEFESEADYVGLYVTARAGYDYGASPDFWRRMSADNPVAITYGSTHPSNSYRAVALEKTVGEIFYKERAGIALEPEFLPE